MKTTAFVSHSDCSRHDTGWSHPEHQGRLPAVARAVYRDMLTLFEPLLEVEGRPARQEDLLLAHAPEYVDAVRRASEEAAAAGQVLDFAAEARISGASWDAALAAAGCALTAVEVVLAGDVRNAFCAVRPPGHQAGHARATGFGLFNNVAMAARHLRVRHGLERVLVVEWSARPGWGTADILAGDPGIRFVSVHQQQADGAVPVHPSARMLALPAGSTGADFAPVAEAALGAATRGFSPQFVLLSAGFDALAADPLGGLALEPADFYLLTTRLRKVAEQVCGGRLVSVLEGGYDPVATGAGVVQHLRALAALEAA